MNTLSFSDWLSSEINQRGWSQRQLADKAQISAGGLSNVINKERTPGPDILIALGDALGYSRLYMFTKAGLLPEIENDFNTTELAEYYSQLSEGRQEMLLLFAQWLVAEQSRLGD